MIGRFGIPRGGGGNRSPRPGGAHHRAAIPAGLVLRMATADTLLPTRGSIRSATIEARSGRRSRRPAWGSWVRMYHRLQQLTKALFETAYLFECERLPELFASHQRDEQHPIPDSLPARGFAPGVVRLSGAVHDSGAVEDVSIRSDCCLWTRTYRSGCQCCGWRVSEWAAALRIWNSGATKPAEPTIACSTFAAKHPSSGSQVHGRLRLHLAST